MCGFVGWVNQKINLMPQKEILEKMIHTLYRRGPDDEGIHISMHSLLAHRRLVVVDPSGGRQPMTRSLEGNEYTIVYNGELYNTEEIRAKLIDKGYKFKSYSDTEVLLVSYIEWGIDCLKKFNGIFAFGIWDENRRTLFIARDQLGVKPLFYTRKGNDFLFASEIKALLAHPNVEPIVDRNGIMEIFGLGPARIPGSGVLKDIYELPPGSYIEFSPERLTQKRYWQLEANEHTDNFDSTVEKVRSLLIDSVQRQLVSDVPICTFLSGGLDSSAISAIAAKALIEKGKDTLNTFSIDYSENDQYFTSNDFQPDSDSVYAHLMVENIGSIHHDVIINQARLADALDEAVKANDLPGMADIDSSLFLFCHEVRKHATVALSGECADEIFGGYPWYWRNDPSDKDTFPWSKALDLRRSILSHEFDSLPLEEFVQEQYKKTLADVPKLDSETENEKRMREIFYLNLKWFMVTLLNRKDRMSMYNSLEVRVPFADYRIVEYAYNIPWHLKYYDNREKGLLRRALNGMLPNEIITRKKSPYPKTHHPEYLAIVKKRLESIIIDKKSPLLQLVNSDKIKELLKADSNSLKNPWFGQLMTLPQLLAYLIQIDVWLKEYKIRIE